MSRLKPDRQRTNAAPEEALRESEERFRTMADGLPLIVWVHGPEGEQQFVNRTFREFFGVSDEETHGDRWHSLVHPEDQERYSGAFMACVRERKAFSAEARVRRADGAWRWIESWGRPRLSPSGAFLGFVGASADITERKNAEAALREQEKSIRDMADTAPAMLWVTDAEHRCMFLSKGWYDFTGQTEESALGMGWTEAIHPDDRERSAATFLTAAERHEPFELDYRLRTSRGVYRWAIDAGRPRLGPDGAFLGYIGSVIDVHERKQAEEQLRRNHETFFRLIENNPFGIYVVDGDFRLAQVSLGAKRVFKGIEPLIGRDFGEILRIIWADPFATEVIDRFRHTLRTGEPYTSPRTIERRNNTPDIEAYDWRIERITLPDGRLGVVCYFYDLSEREEMEAALRQSEARFRLVTESLPQLIWTCRADGVCDYLSPQWVRYTGIPDEPQLGFGWLEAIHPDDRDRVLARWNECSRLGENYQIDYRMRRHDGAYRWFQALGLPLRDASGRVTKWFGSNTDVHDLIEAQRALAESEARFRTLADNMSQFAWMADKTGWIFWYNRRWYEYTGTTLEEVQGWGWKKVHHPDHVDRVVESVQHSWDTGEPWEETFPIRGRDGKYRWFLSRAMPIKDAHGNVVRWFGTNTDVTEQLQAEEELRLHREELQRLVNERTAELEESHKRLRLSERMSALGTLSAGLGHDLGNLLVPMRLWLDDLETMPLPTAAIEDVRSLRRSAEYLKNLAAGLRSLSVDPEDDSAASGRTNVETWWPEVHGLYKAQLSRNMKLHAQIPPGLPSVAVPAPALTQAVFNLIQNAGDAMHERAQGNIWIAARAEDEAVLLSVRDDGPGMSPEVRQRCMEPFYTTKARGRGTGLGLSIVYNVLSRHDVAIELDSRPGGGTVFTLVIPTARRGADVKRVAAVTLGDPRLGAIVRSLLGAMGVEVWLHADDGAPESDLWVVDTAVPEDQLRRFAHGGAMGRYAVRLGASEDLGPNVVAVPELKPGVIRAALSRAARAGADGAEERLQR